MKYAALYLRTATMDYMGIESQKASLERWCKDNEITSTEVYADNGYSGLKLDRPSFQKLLSDVESDKINMVVTTEVSRIGRNLKATDECLSRISSKVRLVVVNNSIDTSLKPYKIFSQ